MHSSVYALQTSSYTPHTQYKCRLKASQCFSDSFRTTPDRKESVKSFHIPLVRFTKNTGRCGTCFFSYTFGTLVLKVSFLPFLAQITREIKKMNTIEPRHQRSYFCQEYQKINIPLKGVKKGKGIKWLTSVTFSG